MEYIVKDIAQRIQSLRDILDISPEEMAKINDISVDDYLKCEEGQTDFSFTFLYNCAKRFGVDLMDLVTGESPKLSFYSIVRSGEGLPIKRRKGFLYNHLGSCFRGKIAEPFVVTAPFNLEEQDKPIHLSYHKGQEFDYVIKGSLKVRLEDHTEVLNEGDSIYYDSGHGHGMIATNGEDCVFLAIVMNVGEGTNEN